MDDGLVLLAGVLQGLRQKGVLILVVMDDGLVQFGLSLPLKSN